MGGMAVWANGRSLLHLSVLPAENEALKYENDGLSALVLSNLDGFASRLGQMSDFTLFQDIFSPL